MTDHQQENDALWHYYQSHLPESFDSSYSRQDYFAKRCKAGTKVLNIGAGSGRLESLLLRKGVDVYSVDPSEKTVTRLNDEIGMKGRAHCAYSHETPFPDDEFDIVIMTEVLEHLPTEQLQLTMEEVRRVLKPGASFIGSVPFRENLRDNEVYCPHCHATFHRWGHLHSFDRESLGQLLSGAGFRVAVLRSQAFPDFSRPGMRSFIRALFRYVLGRLGEQLVGPNIYFEASRRQDAGVKEGLR